MGVKLITKFSIHNSNVKLTKNERLTLKLLLVNSRVTDSEISSKLKISSQAVGKIRRKLEESVIDSYSVNLNYEKLGIHTFAMAIAKLTRIEGKHGELEIEKKLLDTPNIINVFRIPKGSPTYLILYGFQDLDELDNFFHSAKQKEGLHKFIENQDLHTFSYNSLLKSDPNQLFRKVIDDMGNTTLNESLKRTLKIVE